MQEDEDFIVAKPELLELLAGVEDEFVVRPVPEFEEDDVFDIFEVRLESSVEFRVDADVVDVTA